MDIDNHYVIGVGGTGSWLVPKLAKLSKKITLIDGDTLETKNLDRQLFQTSDIGKNKAVALAAKYGCKAIPEYFHSQMNLRLNPNDLLWCCVDNHTGRREVLDMCDTNACIAIIGANEYTDAEAYYYEPAFRGTKKDPRVFYPAINTDMADDPRRPEGCTGHIAELNPQLVLANDWASGLMLQLFWFYTQTRPTLPEDTAPHWPVHQRVSAYKFETIKQGEKV